MNTWSLVIEGAEEKKEEMNSIPDVFKRKSETRGRETWSNMPQEMKPLLFKAIAF